MVIQQCKCSLSDSAHICVYMYIHTLCLHTVHIDCGIYTDVTREDFRESTMDSGLFWHDSCRYEVWPGVRHVTRCMGCVWLSCQLAACITNMTYTLAMERWRWYQPAASPFDTKHTCLCVLCTVYKFRVKWLHVSWIQLMNWRWGCKTNLRFGLVLEFFFLHMQLRPKVGQPGNSSIISRVKLGQTTVQLCKRAGFYDVGHRLGLTTEAQISVCKMPWLYIGSAMPLTSAETVQERPLLSWKGETRLPDCGVVHQVDINHRSQLPGFLPLTSDVGCSQGAP